MSTDYIPASDADFDAWQQNLVNYVVANAAALGVPPADVTSIQGFNGTWGTKYPAATTATAAANAATQDKNDCRSDYEDFLRSFVGRIKSSLSITDAQRQAMAIRVRSTSRTAVGPPTSRPVATIDTSQRL